MKKISTLFVVYTSDSLNISLLILPFWLGPHWWTTIIKTADTLDVGWVVARLAALTCSSVMTSQHPGIDSITLPPPLTGVAPSPIAGPQSPLFVAPSNSSVLPRRSSAVSAASGVSSSQIIRQRRSLIRPAEKYNSCSQTLFWLSAPECLALELPSGWWWWWAQRRQQRWSMTAD